MNSANEGSARHERSKSDCDERSRGDKLESSQKSFQHLDLDLGEAKGSSGMKMGSFPEKQVQSSLSKEIHQLEKRLKDQFVVRRALEKALGYRSYRSDSSNDGSMPKPTKELIKEIAVLEIEVMRLEQYLLSLYRKAFDKQITPLSRSTIGERSKRSLSCQSGFSKDVSRFSIAFKRRNPNVRSSRTMQPQISATSPVYETCSHECQEKLNIPRVNHDHSSQRSSSSARISPSDPLTSLEHEQSAISEVISLADFLGTSIADHVPETPNRISEYMVRCMGAIYYKLAEPPLVNLGSSSSPTSSFSSTSAFSPQYLGDLWSPRRKGESTRDSRLENPFRVEGFEFSGAYNAIIEVPLICKDSQRLHDVEDMLQNFKLNVQRLESVDPSEMKSEEKLAFWINIHNALMMHAYLDHGIPQSNMKRASLFIKDTYFIGGRTVNIEIIQSYILKGCRHRTRLWLRALRSTKLILKGCEDWQAYGIESPEPLIHFALCTGGHSDPAVRIYTPKRVFEQLEAAKEDYIRAAVGIRKEQKILLPKILDSFAKDASLSLQGMLDMIQCYLPETLQMVIQRCQQDKSHKIEWIPYNSAFRYLLTREVAMPQLH